MGEAMDPNPLAYPGTPTPPFNSVDAQPRAPPLRGGPMLAVSDCVQYETLRACLHSPVSPRVGLRSARHALFLTKGIGTPRFGLVEHVNAFVNESEVGIHFVDFG